MIVQAIPLTLSRGNDRTNKHCGGCILPNMYNAIVYSSPNLYTF